MKKSIKIRKTNFVGADFVIQMLSQKPLTVIFFFTQEEVKLEKLTTTRLNDKHPV
jgi:methylase of polypeptide subunit release factors